MTGWARRALSPDARLPVYVAGMVLAAASILAGTVWAGRGPRPLGDQPAAFVLFAVVFVIAEARPLHWWTKQGGGEVTASWPFALAMLLVAPSGSALAMIALTSLSIEVARRKPVSRIIFNVSQLVVSLGLAAGVLHLLSEPTSHPADSLGTLGWVGALLAAGALAVAVNSLFPCIAIALSQGLSIPGTVRMGFGVNMALDGLLIALAPIFVVIADVDLVLVPLLLITVWAIYRSAHTALTNRHEATHDLLTELPNRRLFLETATLAVAAARRGGRRIALIHIDLDGFKAINDRMGHHVGDLVLQHTAQRLNGSRRESDIAARFGGDEFVVLATDVGSADDALGIAHRLLDAIKHPMSIEGTPVSVGGSLGVAMFPDHADDVTTLLQQADVAMYRVKAAGGGAAMFEPATDGHSPGRLSLIADLPRALAAGELHLVFQPQVDVATGRVVGAEGLMRWLHPVHGLIRPDAFIASAEQTEAMDVITMLAVREALDAVGAWRAAGLDLHVSVNVSVHDVQESSFPDRVLSELQQRGLDPAVLEMEITEHAMLSHPSRSLLVLHRLREAGVRIALDDFGTGYSSITSLRTLPADRLKIDPAFTRGMATGATDAAIVRTIIELAHRLQLDVVAEGVEDRATLEELRALGCDVVQGYLLARPMPATDVISFAAASAVTAMATASVAATTTTGGA